MQNIRICKTYAGVFFKHTQLMKSTQKVLDDFSSLSELFLRNSQIERFFSSNLCDLESKIKAIKSCKLDESSNHLLNILLTNGHIKYLPGICSQMLELKLYNEGLTPATLVSASNMEQKEINDCVKILEKKLDKKFSITYKVDKSLIAGVTLSFGTMMYDASVNTALKKLKEL